MRWDVFLGAITGIAVALLVGGGAAMILNSIGIFGFIGM